MSTGGPAAFWFGPEESPLFGTLHTPELAPRGIIVLCPPLGREYAYTHATFVQLAKRLTELGFASLRFDYRSTGDSFERIEQDSDSHGFEKDVHTAIEFARSLGADHVGVVGMRLGANFINRQRHLDPVDAVVLWDPCSTGRSFLREQRALALFAGVRVADESTHALDLPGFNVSPEMAEEITSIDLLAGAPGPAESGRLSDKVLLLTRSERAADPRILERFGLPHIEQRQVPGQPELLDVHDDWPIVPAEGLAAVAAWLDQVMARDGSVIKSPDPGEATVAIVSDAPGSTRLLAGTTGLVREKTTWLGPAGLFGIETESVAGSSGPVCIFVSVANEHRIGPGRLWVQLSRSLALEGFRCARFDVNGFGDSPARDGRSCQTVYAVSAIDDVIDVARTLSPEDPGDVVLFGLCSSAYQILEAALSLSPRAVCSLNPVVNFRPPEMTEGGEIDPRRRFCAPAKKPVVKQNDSRTVSLLKRRLPTFASMLAVIQQAGLLRWRSLNGRLREGPGKRVAELAETGTDVLLICGPYETRRLVEAGLSVGRRNGRHGHLQVEVIPTLDHGLFPANDREQVSRLILNQVISGYQRDSTTKQASVSLSS